MINSSIPFICIAPSPTSATATHSGTRTSPRSHRVRRAPWSRASRKVRPSSRGRVPSRSIERVTSGRLSAVPPDRAMLSPRPAPAAAAGPRAQPLQGWAACYAASPRFPGHRVHAAAVPAGSGQDHTQDDHTPRKNLLVRWLSALRQRLVHRSTAIRSERSGGTIAAEAGCFTSDGSGSRWTRSGTSPDSLNYGGVDVSRAPAIDQPFCRAPWPMRRD